MAAFVDHRKNVGTRLFACSCGRSVESFLWWHENGVLVWMTPLCKADLKHADRIFREGESISPRSDA